MIANGTLMHLSQLLFSHRHFSLTFSMSMLYTELSAPTTTTVYLIMLTTVYSSLALFKMSLMHSLMILHHPRFCYHHKLPPELRVQEHLTILSFLSATKYCMLCCTLCLSSFLTRSLHRKCQHYYGPFPLYHPPRSSGEQLGLASNIPVATVVLLATAQKQQRARAKDKRSA
jgi:hypothetical protein